MNIQDNTSSKNDAKNETQLIHLRSTTSFFDHTLAHLTLYLHFTKKQYKNYVFSLVNIIFDFFYNKTLYLERTNG